MAILGKVNDVEVYTIPVQCSRASPRRPSFDFSK